MNGVIFSVTSFLFLRSKIVNVKRSNTTRKEEESIFTKLPSKKLGNYCMIEPELSIWRYWNFWLYHAWITNESSKAGNKSIILDKLPSPFIYLIVFSILQHESSISMVNPILNYIFMSFFILSAISFSCTLIYILFLQNTL